MTNFQSELKKLKEKYIDNDDLKTINDWEKEFKKAEVISSLSKNDAMVILSRELQSKVNDINTLLQHQREMTETERNNLFIKRDCWEWYLQLFPEANKKMKEIIYNIKDNVKDIEV